MAIGPDRYQQPGATDVSSIDSHVLLQALLYIPRINASLRASQGRRQASYDMLSPMPHDVLEAVIAVYHAAGWPSVKTDYSRHGNLLIFTAPDGIAYQGVREPDYTVPFSPEDHFSITPEQSAMIDGLEHDIDAGIRRNYRGSESFTFDMDRMLKPTELAELKTRYMAAGWKDVQQEYDYREGSYLMFRR